ncbi:hypothetical protein CYMTET_21126, partial [Cymbomonas tetramitiformis]
SAGQPGQLGFILVQDLGGEMNPAAKLVQPHLPALLDQHYPQLMSSHYIINSPSKWHQKFSFSLTKSKCKVLSSTAELERIIHKDNLPTFLGGDGRNELHMPVGAPQEPPAFVRTLSSAASTALASDCGPSTGAGTSADSTTPKPTATAPPQAPPAQPSQEPQQAPDARSCQPGAVSSAAEKALQPEHASTGAHSAAPAVFTSQPSTDAGTSAPTPNLFYGTGPRAGAAAAPSPGVIPAPAVPPSAPVPQASAPASAPPDLAAARHVPPQQATATQALQAHPASAAPAQALQAHPASAAPAQAQPPLFSRTVAATSADPETEEHSHRTAAPPPLEAPVVAAAAKPPRRMDGSSAHSVSPLRTSAPGIRAAHGSDTENPLEVGAIDLMSDAEHRQPREDKASVAPASVALPGRPAGGMPTADEGGDMEAYRSADADSEGTGPSLPGPKALQREEQREQQRGWRSEGQGALPEGEQWGPASEGGSGRLEHEAGYGAAGRQANASAAASTGSTDGDDASSVGSHEGRHCDQEHAGGSLAGGAASSSAAQPMTPQLGLQHEHWWLELVAGISQEGGQFAQDLLRTYGGIDQPGSHHQEEPKSTEEAKKGLASGLPIGDVSPRNLKELLGMVSLLQHSRGTSRNAQPVEKAPSGQPPNAASPRSAAENSGLAASTPTPSKYRARSQHRSSGSATINGEMELDLSEGTRSDNFQAELKCRTSSMWQRHLQVLRVGTGLKDMIAGVKELSPSVRMMNRMTCCETHAPRPPSPNGSKGSKTDRKHPAGSEHLAPDGMDHEDTLWSYQSGGQHVSLEDRAPPEDPPGEIRVSLEYRAQSPDSLDDSD